MTQQDDPETQSPAAQAAADALPQSPASPAPALASPPDLRPRGRHHLQERVIGGLLFAASAVSILTTLGIIVVLVVESFGFFVEVSPLDFLTGTRWAPLFRPQSFGVLPLMTGSLLVAACAAWSSRRSKSSPGCPPSSTAISRSPS